MQTTCSMPCAMVEARQRMNKARHKAALASRRETKAKLKALMTRSDWLRRAQTAFNAWVRVRDHDKPCVSCGASRAVQWHASHYRSVGACPALRFDPLNVHKSCSQCNDWKGGNVIEYRIELAKRITPEQLAYLEGPHEPRKLTIPQIQAIEEHYKILTKGLA